jgi:hypothetical protein
MLECPKPGNTTRSHQIDPNGFQLVNSHGGTFYDANHILDEMEVDRQCID